jgi:hypothetical protein
VDSGCFIPDPRILIFTHPGYRIPDPDPKIATKERGEKISCHTFFCSHKFHKIEYYLTFEMLKKIKLPNFQRIIEVFTQKLSPSSQKYGFGIQDPEKTYSGSWIGAKRHRKYVLDNINNFFEKVLKINVPCSNK